MADYSLLQDPDMKEIFDSFIIETREILDKLDLDLVEIEKTPEDTDLLNDIFRSFHTIKGTSGFLGLEKLQRVTHRCEDILNRLRKGEVKLSTAIMDGILLAYDTIKALVEHIETNLNEDIEVEPVVETLQGIYQGFDAPQEVEIEITPENLAALALELEESQKQKEAEKVAASEVVTPVVEESVPIDVSEENKAKILESITKVNVIEDETEVHEEEEAKPTVQKVEADAQNAHANRAKGDNTIRVEVQRLDELLNLVSELVLGRNRLTQIYKEASIHFEGSKLTKDLEDTSRQIDLMTTELQLAVMKTRMIKIGKVFNRYPRVVRDLSKDAGKKIRLDIFGEETELDKTLIEEINDPLVHLIRNSIDHAIEMPKDRIAQGKGETGVITLSAVHEGNDIIITVQDDGRGIDPEKIKNTAIKKGLITEEKAKELSKQEILALIFLPGFSTAEKVTNISGRGVGMDVVKTNVTKLRGIINIDSEVGIGTKMMIRLPLTLAIIQGLLVTVAEQTLVIPLNSVIEVVKVQHEQIKYVNKKEVIKLRDTILPLINIDSLLYGVERSESTSAEYVVVVGVAEKRFGIKVEELVGQREVVIKSLGNYLGNISGLAGSTIMGDGRVVIILDLAELINKISE